MKRTTYLRLRSQFGQDDRGDEEDGLEIIQVEESEKVTKWSGELDINVRYVYGPKLDKFRNYTSNFGASFDLYSHEGQNGTARLTNGAFYIDPEPLRGRGIGTYVMNRVVEWVKQHAPQAAQVRSVMLSANDARKGHDGQPDFGNIARRARVYENVGLKFCKREEKDIPDAAGHSYPLTVGDLHQVSPESLLPELDFVKEFRSLSEKIRDTRNDHKKLTRANDHLRSVIEKLRIWHKRFLLLLLISLALNVFLMYKLA